MAPGRVSDKLVSPPPLASSAGNGVTRAELLLSGNGAQALVDSVAAWSATRFGVRGCAL